MHAACEGVGGTDVIGKIFNLGKSVVGRNCIPPTRACIWPEHQQTFGSIHRRDMTAHSLSLSVSLSINATMACVCECDMHWPGDWVSVDWAWEISRIWHLFSSCPL